jgi:hypothetical protein
MDHGSAVEKLEGVREIETSLRQDFLALFLIPLEFQRGNLIGVITICNHTCIHAVLSSALSGGIAVSGFVIPAQAGIQHIINGLLDARVRGHDRRGVC